VTTRAGKRATAAVLPKAGGLLDFKPRKRQGPDLEARLEANARWFVVGMADQILQQLQAALNATQAALFPKAPKAPKARKQKPASQNPWEDLEVDSEEEDSEEEQELEPPPRSLPSFSTALCTLVCVALFITWAVLFVRRHIDAVRIFVDGIPFPFRAPLPATPEKSNNPKCSLRRRPNKKTCRCTWWRTWWRMRWVQRPRACGMG
jgi:hypothetical protein